MIYNDQFVWLHFPKCAGLKIENLFKRYFSDQKGLFQDPVGVENDPSIAWHDSIYDRVARDPEFDLGERAVICSFRRLPFWLESRYSFEFRRSPNLSHRPELLLKGKFFESTGVLNHADYYARKYLPKPILKSGIVRFVRTEFFESDFKTVFGDFLDISRIPEWEYEVKENVTETCLPEDVKRRLYDNEKKTYKKCPYWRKVEKIAYGRKNVFPFSLSAFLRRLRTALGFRVSFRA